jgi:hypothetical protein
MRQRNGSRADQVRPRHGPFRAPFKAIMRKASILCLWQIGEFTQGLPSCYLLSNENTLFAAQPKTNNSAIRLIIIGRLEIHMAVALTAIRSRMDKGDEARRWK